MSSETEVEGEKGFTCGECLRILVGLGVLWVVVYYALLLGLCHWLPWAPWC